MKAAPLVRVAMLVATATTALALPAFNGVMSSGGITRCLLIDQSHRAWVEVGGRFYDYLVEQFDAKHATLRIAKNGQRFSLPLVPDAAVLDGGSIDFHIHGAAIALTPTDAARLRRKVEALISSANFHSGTKRGTEYGQGFVWWTPLEKLKQGSFLHESFDPPQPFDTGDGPLRVSEAWVEIKDQNPDGGLLPGPVTVLVDGKPIYLIKVSGQITIELGHDPAIFKHLPGQMQRSLGPAPR